MRNLLEILTSIIIAVAFINGTDKSTNVVLENPANCQTTETLTIYSDSSESASSLYLPRRTSCYNIQRPITAKRTNSTYKSHIAFTRTGKVISSCLQKSIHKTSLTNHSSNIKPAHRLISFGKLVI